MGKKLQQHKIHTQLHQDTVALMMNSLKLLAHQDVEVVPEIEPETNSTYYQKPYWPVLTKKA